MDFSDAGGAGGGCAARTGNPNDPGCENTKRLLKDRPRRKAFEEGRVQALQDLQTKQETLLTEEVGRLVGVVGASSGNAGRGPGRTGETMRSACISCGQTAVCAHLIARQPLAETVALVSECLGPLRKAPHLVIRIAEKDVDALKAQVDPIVHEKGFDGRLVILGEPEIEPGRLPYRMGRWWHPAGPESA